MSSEGLVSVVQGSDGDGGILCQQQIHLRHVSEVCAIQSRRPERTEKHKLELSEAATRPWATCWSSCGHDESWLWMFGTVARACGEAKKDVLKINGYCKRQYRSAEWSKDGIVMPTKAAGTSGSRWRLGRTA